MSISVFSMASLSLTPWKNITKLSFGTPMLPPHSPQTKPFISPLRTKAQSHGCPASPIMTAPSSTSRTHLLKEKFIDVYSVLKSELLNDPDFQWDDDSRTWLEQMMDYNVPGGKLNRGLSVVESYMILKGKETITDDEFFLASALGWCLEWFQAFALIFDDIMDESQTRRGQPCWFRVPQVGMIAINDGVILRNQIQRILKNHFKDKPYYVDLLDLFNEAEFQTASGQMIDLIATIGGRKDLNKYDFSRYYRIVHYKTSYYSLYLPVAVALLIFGENLNDHGDIKTILFNIGIIFQVQDDFLDCYGDPDVTGKIGTDIQDNKCSWLVVRALELCNDEQRKLLIENYGKQEQECVSKVEEVYRELDLHTVFQEYESMFHEMLCKSIDAHPNSGIQAILRSFLSKIYKRHK